MSKPTKNAPAGAGTPAGAENDTITDQMRSSSLTTIDPEAACRHCTVPVESGDVCSWCASYTPPAACTSDVWCGCTCPACTITFEHCGTGPLIVDGLLADGMAELVTARIFDGLPSFPLPGGWVCTVDREGTRIVVTASHRDPATRQTVNREFVAELREVM